MNRPYSITFVSLFLMLVFSNTVLAQFTDDFSDGDFTNNPVWSGSASLFTVNAEELNSNSPGAATYYLSTPSTLATEAQWEFFINLKFSTSGANYVDVFLVADNADLTTTMNGYFVRVGNTADEISLYKLVGGSETMIIDGADGLVNSSSNNPFNIRVSRDATDMWLLEVDDGALGSYTIEGSVIDNDVNTGTHFGVLIEQSSAAGPMMNHFFDNFSVSAIVPDTDAPTINSINPISSTTIDVEFSELLDQTTAEVVANYSIDGGIGQPLSAALDGSDNSLVHLVFSNAFINNTQFQLTVQNVEDLSGNAITTEQASFTFFIPEIAAIGDVLINEIMPDPNPVVGLPDAEYVEIYNNSGKYIDLNGFTLSGSEISDTQFIIGPDEYVILCDDDVVADFQMFGEVIGVLSWNGLTNGGETVTLKDNNNNLVLDEVDYDESWYQDEERDGGGYSLERINPDSSCDGALNWGASTDAKGGTPGEQNALFDNEPDTQAPSIVNIKNVGFSQLMVDFNEAIDPSTVDVSSFTISNGINIQQVIPQTNSSVSIDLSNTLVGGNEYTLSVLGIGDCSGNIIMSPGVDFTFEVLEIVKYKDIVINEIMPDPVTKVNLPESEFLELFNNSTKKIDLNGYTLNGKELIGSTYLFLPGEYLIICPFDSVSLFSGYGQVLGVPSWDGLNNSGETITLNSALGETIDDVGYDKSWYNSSTKDEGGWTLELIDPENLCSDKRNWTASISSDGGTPGAINSVDASKPDLTGPILDELEIVNANKLYLYFDEALDSISIPLAEYILEPNINIGSISFDNSLRVVDLSLSSPLVEEVVYTIAVNNVTDCSGNLIGEDNSLMFALPKPAADGDIIINEVLFNERTGSDDFVEVYNNSDNYVNLQGWFLANEDDEANVDNIKLVSERFKLIAPGELIAFTTDAQSLAGEYPFSNQKQYVEIPSMPSYPNKEGTVLVLKPDQSVHDRFQYNEDMHHPLLNDVDGVSLERISYDNPTNDPNNWHSAASNVFATPGSINSQFRQSITASGNVEVSPRTFVPDNSGSNDFTTINYQFDQPGFVANVKILDATGQEVARIAENTLLASSGFFTWGGTFDDGRKAKIGVYIVYFEVFDSLGQVELYRERVAIGSGW